MVTFPGLGLVAVAGVVRVHLEGSPTGDDHHHARSWVARGSCRPNGLTIFDKFDFKVVVGKINTTKTVHFNFFQCLFVRRVEAVILKLCEGTIFSFVKFKFHSKNSKIERAFKKLTTKMGQKGHKLSNQNGPEITDKIPYLRKNTF